MQIEPNTFICADSIDVLREIQDKAFDLCLTDPPYGINADIKMQKNNGNFGFKKRLKTQWDQAPATRQLLDECRRVSANQIFWGGNYFDLPPTPCFLIWDKVQRIDQADAEIAWSSFLSATRVFAYARGNESGFAPMLKNSDKFYANSHPTQKPISLFVWCLLNYSKPGDLIIDPFCGSGTTAISCHKTGRKFLCIDKDEEYIKIAQQRYADLIAQQDLFGQNEDGAQNTSEGRGTAYNSAMLRGLKPHAGGTGTSA
jgi:DNA modification methylase